MLTEETKFLRDGTIERQKFYFAANHFATVCNILTNENGDGMITVIRDVRNLCLHNTNLLQFCHIICQRLYEAAKCMELICVYINTYK